MAAACALRKRRGACKSMFDKLCLTAGCDLPCCDCVEKKMSVPIKLTDLIPIAEPHQYKLHLACMNDDGIRPLDEYVAGNWRYWNEWRGKRNDWTRKRVFSLIEYWPLNNAYLFGGVFEVLQRLNTRYKLAIVPEYQKWEGRLVCRFVRYKGMRGRAFYLENFLDSFEVIQLLPERYDGESFCGYQNINHKLGVLKSLVDNEKQDWKAALHAVKGVYLIIDAKDGRAYVGSAYAEAGIWSRLTCYVGTGHGWNDGLMAAIKNKGLDYALANYQFSILEVFTFHTPDETILEREAHWKRVMLSRSFGYNLN